MKKGKKTNKGFSLIELLIVVAIILIIAAIAIPNLVRARISANEASATASMRTIGSGQLLYRSSNNRFTDLAGLSGDSIIDTILGGGTKSGYTFGCTNDGTTGLTFTATATFQSAYTGKRTYFVDQTQVIRYTTNGSQATGSSTPLD